MFFMVKPSRLVGAPGGQPLPVPVPRCEAEDSRLGAQWGAEWRIFRLENRCGDVVQATINHPMIPFFLVYKVYTRFRRFNGLV